MFTAEEFVTSLCNAEGRKENTKQGTKLESVRSWLVSMSCPQNFI